MSPGRPIVVLTGAGISAESGVSTFRDPDGVWARHRVEDVATPDAFRRNPALVHSFYNERRRLLQDPRVAPNAAHVALAELQRARPGEVVIVTQNVDDLHERAGADPIHMHGELLKARCARCEQVCAWTGDMDTSSVCPSCGRAGSMRPHVVWFGEEPLEMDRIGRALGRCGLFVAIGTSGQVYPAAGFVQMARWRAGARTVELNLESTGLSDAFDASRLGPATQVVPAFVEGILTGREAV
jgi:NAD-dependent deacetylase